MNGIKFTKYKYNLYNDDMIDLNKNKKITKYNLNLYKVGYDSFNKRNLQITPTTYQKLAEVRN